MYLNQKLSVFLMSKLNRNITLVRASTTLTMEAKQKLQISLVAQCLLTTMVGSAILVLYDGTSDYIKFGPSEKLEILGFKIDTPKKYLEFQLFMLVVEVTNCLVNEIATPILNFSTYNPEKKHITDFTKNELHFYTNAFWLISGVRSVLSVLISISQIDIAILRVLYSEVTSIFTVRFLLNEKTFGKKDDATSDGDTEKLLEMV